jgi:hypothetical protein
MANASAPVSPIPHPERSKTANTVTPSFFEVTIWIGAESAAAPASPMASLRVRCNKSGLMSSVAAFDDDESCSYRAMIPYL